MQLIRKRSSLTLKLLVYVLLLLATLCRLTLATAAADYTVEDNLIKLSNAHYEVAFHSENGAIAYILDTATQKNVSDGNAGGNLWLAALDNAKSVASGSSDEQFTYDWDGSSTLKLSYRGTLDVDVTVTTDDSPTLKMQASVTNHTGANVSGFELPSHLEIVQADVQDALLPMMPGTEIGSKFFTSGRTFINEYPGVFFADYVAVRSGRGKLTLYSQRGSIFQPVFLGFETLQNPAGSTGIAHKYQTWVADAKSWTTPTVMLNVGQDYPDTIANYRMDNRIDQFQTLSEKLGDKAQRYFSEPMYKLDLQALHLKFTDLPEMVIGKMNFPGMVHFVAFQTNGHDHNYPDFIPPDPKRGTTDDFAQDVKLLHDQDSLVVPYTNFSWWNPNSPTLTKLPADVKLNTIMDIKQSSGLPNFETYGANTGYVMDMQSPFVQDKITEQHDALLNTVDVDGIFEDQWGARSAPYDFNPVGLDVDDPATSYFEGVLDHYKAHIASNLMTEEGVDALAENGIGFMGTNYLWDMLGYRGTTADVTTYYPMAGMMLRDKVLLYQHDLAEQTWTQNKDMLRWNLAQGYNLSNAFLDSDKSALNMDNPWLNLVGVFQKYALANYADQLVQSYDDLGNNVSKTTFSSYTVYANWDANQPYTAGDDTLPPGGVVTEANDGSVTGGVFTAYNGHALSDGDHYLVEVRADDGIKVFQPVGADTELHIQNNSAWGTPVVTAYQYNGTAIGTVSATTDGDSVVFTYGTTVNGKPVGYCEIAPAG